MEKVSATGIENYTEKIGNDGAIMNIRLETTPEGKLINAPVKKNGKELAILARQQDGKIILVVRANVEINKEEFSDIFNKAASVLLELVGI